MNFLKQYFEKIAQDIVPPQGQPAQDPNQVPQEGALNTKQKGDPIDNAIQKAQASVMDADKKAQEAMMLAQAEKAKLEALVQQKQVANELVPGGMPKAASDYISYLKYLKTLNK